QALLEQKQGRLTGAEKSALAAPETGRTPQQQKLVAGAKIALMIPWEEVAAAVAANPEHHATRERLKREIHAVEVTAPRPAARAMALVDDGKEIPDTHVARRGDPKSKGQHVAPR